ncbi:type VI secretion system tube protein TssD [Hymenobacter terrenus]|uniref:type VI secretion system tube protein TssD n=1 Tax=Hymenobacter terrenus TaxID=1629124 RepID=UPI000696D766|nr:type VI secretion system tube protein TssD [Hymenobacter terrenus]
MPATLHAEFQGAGVRARCTNVSYSLYQPIDGRGRPSSTVRPDRLKLTFTGDTAFWDIWEQLVLDSFRRISGHVGFFQAEGHTRHRLTFYDAYCVDYELRFDARGRDGQPSLEVDVYFSAAALALDGAHLEAHSDLWWEPDAQVRFRALTKPADLLPSPHLAANLQPPPPPVPPATARPESPKPPKTALNPRKKTLYAPTIAKWYKKGGSIEVLPNGNWKYTDWEHNSVEYEGDEPNFDKYARQQVDIDDMTGDCTKDFAAANKAAPLGRKLRDNTWHHKQNARTMQEVNTQIHDRFTHYGARHVLKKRKAQAVQTAPTKLTKRPRPS